MWKLGSLPEANHGSLYPASRRTKLSLIHIFKSDGEQEIRGYELGGDAYSSKPFHPKHLLAVVHQILNNRLSLRDYYNSVISSSDV